jgi:hypothetical protein
LGRVRGGKIEQASRVWLGETEEERVVGFNMLRSLFQLAQARDVYIERPLVNAKFTSPLTGMMMTRSATYIEIAAMMEGVSVHFLPVQTWRKTIFGSSRLEHPKDAAVNYVRLLGYQLPDMGVRKKQPDHNYAEAICIAMAGYILQEEGMPE